MPGARDLLGVAVEHATAEVPRASPEQEVGEVRDAIVGTSYESAVDIAVLAGDELVGIVSIEGLLAADRETPMEALMDPDPPVVAPGEDQEVAAWVMCRRAEESIAVVDTDGRFVGLIRANRMLEVLLAEHDEDMARIGGFLAGSGRARRAAEESVARRLRHRLPWLLIGLLGAMASALLVGAFEEELDKKVVLAFFVPAVVYMADAVGGQTRVVLIRGLSVGVAIRGVARTELITGAIVGAVVGVAFVPFALIGWGDGSVAAAVGLALFASCAISTVVAMALPWAFQRFGADPAFGSGPLATVIQDLLSIAVYLAIALPLAT
ncbi:MAG TPA: magnesium transporter [Solirubrobacterales bacterium]|nr:magnesium transporter [Solirubrobacterales bacterium]